MGDGEVGSGKGEAERKPWGIWRCESLFGLHGRGLRPRGPWWLLDIICWRARDTYKPVHHHLARLVGLDPVIQLPPPPAAREAL